jgi:GDP-D-mannose dehydratase
MIKSAINVLPEMGDVRIDSKSRLQEFIQQDKEQKEVLEYRLTGERGPDHNKTFTVDLYLGANCIGSGQGAMLKDYIIKMRDAANPECEIGLGKRPYAPNQVMHLCADITKLTEDTGFIPTYTFDEGIAKTVAWVRADIEKSNE